MVSSRRHVTIEYNNAVVKTQLHAGNTYTFDNCNYNYV